MFEEKTVIILGAGASADNGFPLGAELKNNIANGLRNRNNQETTSGSARGIVENPYGSFLEFMCSPGKSLQFDPDQFISDLEESSQQSIDRFLRENPAYNFYGKCFITLELLRCMIDPTTPINEGASYRNIPSIKPYKTGWVAHIVNEFNEGATNAEDLKKNQLEIITFNYDMSLENILDRQIGKAEIFKGADRKAFIPIHHVHGSVSTPEPLTSYTMEDVASCAGNMSLIGEISAPKNESTPTSLKQIVSSAKRVFMIGFAFDKWNTDLLGLGSTNANHIFVLNYDGNLGVHRRIEGLGIPPKNIISGSRGNPISIAQALSDGFLEQRGPVANFGYVKEVY